MRIAIILNPLETLKQGTGVKRGDEGRLPKACRVGEALQYSLWLMRGEQETHMNLTQSEQDGGMAIGPAVIFTLLYSELPALTQK